MITLILIIVALLAPAVILIVSGIWLVKKQYGVPYQVLGVSVIIMGSLLTFFAILVAVFFLLFTGPETSRALL